MLIYWIFVYFLTVFTIYADSKNIECPDHESSCPRESTCCLLADGEYGCCPIPEAVCCSDHIHCCPHDTTCDTEQARCLRGDEEFGIHRKHPAIKPQKVVDSNEDDDELFSEDSVHLKNKKITSTKHYHNPIIHDNQPRQNAQLPVIDGEKTYYNRNMFMAKAARHAEIDQICPDGKSKCPAHTTCCPLNDDEDGSNSDDEEDGDESLTTIYGCCPSEGAICCEDKLHCCPHNTHCDVEEARCLEIKSGYSRPWLKKFASTKIIQKPSIALEDSSIECGPTTTTTSGGPDNLKNYIFSNTCLGDQKCCMKNSEDGTITPYCCQHPNGICCGNNYCCPFGFMCSNEKGKSECVLRGFSKVRISTNPLETIPTKPKQTKKSPTNSETICADGSRCDSRNTCCPVLNPISNKIESYKCCALSNANCCKNSCCPRGYQCVFGNLCEKSSLNELISDFISFKKKY